MKKKNFVPLLLVLSGACTLLFYSSCHKTYTKDEIISKIKSDEDFIQLIHVKAASYEKTLAGIQSVSTPVMSKSYQLARQRKDTAYLRNFRNQISRPSIEDRKKQMQLFLKLYKRYMKKDLISKADFGEMYKKALQDEYKKVFQRLVLNHKP